MVSNTSQPSPIYCQECGRANNASAKRCIWCNLPLLDGSDSGSFEPTRVEIDYIGGIERLEDSATVKMVIDASGIEISEVLPGSRNIRIPAEDIIEARVLDSTSIVEGERVRPTWWWFAFGPFALARRGRKLPDTVKHDYILTIIYRDGTGMSSAAFHREDRLGSSMVNGLARVITALVRRTTEQSKL
ncbi:MAG: hypothetical protein L0229_05505 [Blastocatellia bacterium]|nr:hypothetical protein [Blastocatellia bacterium]